MPVNTLSKDPKAVNEILARASLDFVIDMPQQLFFEQQRGVKTSIFGFTKTSNGHDQSSLVTFMDMEDDGHQVRSGAGRRDTGRWPAIAEAAERVIRDRVEDEKTRSWRSPIFDENGRLHCRGVRANPWPKTQEHDWDTAVADYQEARAQREEAVAKMSEVLTRAGIGGFDV